MVFSSPDFPATITLQPIPGFMLLTKVCLNPRLFGRVLHTTLWSVHQINFQPIFTAPSHLVSPPRFHFSNHIPISHTSQLTTHTTHIPSIYMVFEYRNNIRNQTVSTVIPSPSSFRDITTIKKHQYLRETFYLMFFQTVLHIAKHSTGTPSIGFHS